MAKPETNMLKLSIKEATPLIERAIERRQPVFLHGQPGVGKSQIVKQIAERLGRPMIDIRLALYDPSDLKGVPYFNSNDGEMHWSTPSELPRAGRIVQAKVAKIVDDAIQRSTANLDEGHAILFLDELSNAPLSVQAAAYQLVLDRRIGQYQLPDNVAIIAAGNRMTDRGAAHKIAAPLANRFAAHIEIEPLFSDWISWALQEGIQPAVLGFLSNATQYWNTFEQNKDAYAYATPRMWEIINTMLDDSDDRDMAYRIVAGAVGEGIAIAFVQHRELLIKIPKVEDIFEGVKISLKDVPVSVRYTLVYNIAFALRDVLKRYGATSDEYMLAFDNVYKFMTDEIEPELNILAARIFTNEFKLPINAKRMPHFDRWWDKVGPYMVTTRKLP